ncbi:hypothetical protein KW799_00705 [Candidatus Parcubacteria bacterium]|nr:hypothetical protein [Candidatus Parcubacteria bacterium]
MTYLRRSNRGPKRARGAAIAAIVALALVFSVNYFFPRAFPSLLYPVSSLFWKSESGIVGWFVYMGKIAQSKYSLVKENRRLSDEIAARDRSILALDALQSENESLKTALGRTGKENHVLGVILSRPPVAPYDTLVVDAGTGDGVKAGDKVYAEGDVLIGDVTEAFGGQSKISLFSTPGRITSVLVGTSTIAAEATGRGGGNFIVKLPAKISVVKGAVITVPSIRSHVFGVVDAVIVDSTGSLQTILFKSPVNISQLRFVEIGRK